MLSQKILTFAVRECKGSSLLYEALSLLQKPRVMEDGLNGIRRRKFIYCKEGCCNGKRQTSLYSS